MAKSYDVIVVGAGAAGLACAATLLKQRLNVLVIEARDRIGGRVQTLFHPGSSLPVELGAEFIHGAPPGLLHLFELFQQPFYDLQNSHHLFENGKLKEFSKFFEKMNTLVGKMGRGLKKDRSVAFMLGQIRNESPQIRDMFRGYIEGFQAADMNLISLCSLMDGEDDSELNSRALFRPLLGYSSLFSAWAHELLSEDRIRFSTPVRKIRWKKNRVTVHCESTLSASALEFQTPCLVMAAPFGVLKMPASLSNGISWDPLPPHWHQMLEGLEMGHVQRLTFRFQDRFWENLVRDKPLGFVHLKNNQDFPTWWTSIPVRSKQLVAWQGGPRAQEMSRWSFQQKVDTALQTLSKWSGRKVPDLANWLESCDGHDWSSDPYSMGAYSYVKTDGLPAAHQFMHPIDQTIYFAGEATCFGTMRGTVHGAVESGYRASRQILKNRQLTYSGETKNAKSNRNTQKTKTPISRSETEVSRN